MTIMNIHTEVNVTWETPVTERQLEHRILVCGARDWIDARIINDIIEGVHFNVLMNYGVLVVIEGGAPGADQLAGKIADSDTRIKHECYPANWKRFGRAAGPIRNQQMLDEGQPDVVYAFHDNIYESKGTKDMVNRAKKAGIPVYIIGRYYG